ncbi:MAG: putative dehydrogenase, partial [Spirosomataceae bacterium]
MKRRDFIKASSFGVAGISVIPSHILGKKVGKIAPSDKVNLACCGIGNRGGDITKALHKTGLANIVAFCDVDMGAPHTLEILKQFPNVPRFQDFREMFDKMGSQVDAVSVGTPDFSHFPITMLAMSLGK